MSNKYSQKLLDSAKKSATNPIKTASKKAIQKSPEPTGDLIGNKTADRMRNLLHNNIIMEYQEIINIINNR